MNIGAYVPGTNLEFDVAVQARPRIVQFLQQDAAAPLKLEQSVRQLSELSAWIEQLEKALRRRRRSPGPPPPPPNELGDHAQIRLST